MEGETKAKPPLSLQFDMNVCKVTQCLRLEISFPNYSAWIPALPTSLAPQSNSILTRDHSYCYTLVNNKNNNTALKQGMFSSSLYRHPSRI